MRLPGRHHRSRHAGAGGMKTAAPPATTAVRFAPSVRTAGELVAEQAEHQHAATG
ncbi:MAG: hypothetical protein ACYDH6_02360 [Acidimicrobiales bacterium]